MESTAGAEVPLGMYGPDGASAVSTLHHEGDFDRTQRTLEEERRQRQQLRLENQQIFEDQRQFRVLQAWELAAPMSNNTQFPPFEVASSRSPTASQAGSQPNGNPMNAGAGYTGMAPLPVGHQQDLNFLYCQIQELSSQLAFNREKVGMFMKSAELVARMVQNGAANGTTGDEGGGDEGSKDTGEAKAKREDEASRIRELELQLARANRVIDAYKHEQSENTRLIAMYEDGMGTATEQIRNYCSDNNDRYLAQRRHYNELLQAEKDEHLKSRLERDHWHAWTIRCSEMIRTAHRLRCAEFGEELAVISGLQNEVRVYRNALGMEKERPEEETGWEWLKEAPDRPDGEVVE